MGLWAYRATFELPGFSAMSASRFLRTTTRRSDEDVMETTPEARSTSDHPSRVEFIVKMAPQSPCSSNRRTMIPAAGERDGNKPGLMPPARHGAGHHERRHLAPRALHLLLHHLEVRPDPALQPLGFSPLLPSREVLGWAPVSSYSRSKQLRTGNNNNKFRSRRN